MDNSPGLGGAIESASGYLSDMAKQIGKSSRVPAPGKIVRDASTGRLVEVRGYGALKGQLNITKGVDLTKPIYDQIKKKPTRSAPKHP